MSILMGRPLTEQVILVIDYFVASKRIFSKFDVTKEIRRNVGPNTIVHHDSVKAEVEKLMSDRSTYTSRHNTDVGYIQYIPQASPATCKVEPIYPVPVVKDCTFGSSFKTNGAERKILAQRVISPNKAGLHIPKELSSKLETNYSIIVKKNGQIYNRAAGWGFDSRRDIRLSHLKLDVLIPHVELILVKASVTSLNELELSV